MKFIIKSWKGWLDKLWSFFVDSWLAINPNSLLLRKKQNLQPSFVIGGYELQLEYFWNLYWYWWNLTLSLFLKTIKKSCSTCPICNNLGYHDKRKKRCNNVGENGSMECAIWQKVTVYCVSWPNVSKN